MKPKSKHEASLRRQNSNKVFKKRTFRGNQYSKNTDSTVIFSAPTANDSIPDADPSLHSPPTRLISSSAKKMRTNATIIHDRSG